MQKIFSLVLLLSAYCSFAQLNDNPLKSTLDSAVDKLVIDYMKEGKRVGLSIGVRYSGGASIYNYGETSPGSGILPTSRSVYEIGSITKTFTGLLISHAITEGRMALNDDIRKFLPGSFPNLQYPNGDPVKIVYLLGHTAQFPNSFRDPLNPPMNNAIFLDSIRKIRLDSLHSFRYEYSNVGYQLLALILERMYKKPYAHLVSKYITGRLEMRETKSAYPSSEIQLLLKGYGANKELMDPTPVTLPGAGGLSSCVNDMLNYLYYQNSERTPTVRLTHQIIVGDVDKEAYGFQWAIGKTRIGDRYIRIDGGTNGFRSFCVMYPLHKVSIVILSNQKDDSAGIGLYKIATGIYGAIKEMAGPGK